MKIKYLLKKGEKIMLMDNYWLHYDTFKKKYGDSIAVIYEVEDEEHPYMAEKAVKINYARQRYGLEKGKMYLILCGRSSWLFKDGEYTNLWDGRK